MAYRILHIHAFVDNQSIPFEMIRDAASYSGETGAASNESSDTDPTSDDDDEEIISAITRLREFSFLSLRTSSNNRSQTYEMHKLVQEATRYGLSRPGKQDEEAYFSSAALQVVSDLFPAQQRNLWDECEKYVGHAQQVGEWAGICKREPDVIALLKRVSDYLYNRGRWREREVIDSRIYSLCSRQMGSEHPETLQSMANLAATYHKLGRYKEAEHMMVEVLALRRELLGDKHPATVRSMADLAATYHALGRYEEAETMKVEVLALRRGDSRRQASRYGPEHGKSSGDIP